MIRKAGLVGLLNRRSRKELDFRIVSVKVNTLQRDSEKIPSDARIFTIQDLRTENLKA